MKLFTKTAAAAALVLVGGAAHAVPSFSFLIDGDTFSQPFSFSNDSTAGEMLTGFGMSLVAGYCFDTDDPATSSGCNTSVGVDFTPVGTAAADTGLLGIPDILSGDTTFSIAFSDFSVGESFAFDIDVDGAPPNSVTVLGSDLIGSTAFADFSDGQRVVGTFQAVAGNSDAAFFTATGIIDTPTVPLPAGLPLILGAVGAFGFLRMRKSKKA